ncbi:Nif3-like dinuclear metal center hexameric protein [Haloferula rosea]|uniref:GTP cyclohydrolase 1 type 2 homolog n=1 Tax=Haloferula rosea TaxID=490093 RepID=A0A934RHD5_9BACT|nr:Nif3-like dinuclear metal center hexameric protein [Haloferula rosea]MBK1828561.1 Nif3-like dinuclear metal center hexameric protein [Haloferula rosea]
MADLGAICQFLEQSLKTSEIADYSGAVNGLQLENPGPVTKVAAAVDASLPVIEKAIAAGADLMLVHHGLFWQGAQPMTGANYRKIKAAMDAGMAIYSSHLPLDVHPEWGNNVGLARAMGLADWQPFMDWKGMAMGLRAEVDWSRDELVERVKNAVGARVHHCPGGPERIGSVGIVTGGAGSQVADAAAAGVEAFVTGEGPHWSYPLAEELGINLVYGGHYATETFGVKALAEELARTFQLEWEFVDHPTGL